MTTKAIGKIGSDMFISDMVCRVRSGRAVLLRPLVMSEAQLTGQQLLFAQNDSYPYKSDTNAHHC